jgi:hypothetical protein
MTERISTAQGDIAFVRPPIELLQAIRRFMPFGATRYVPSREGADYGIVMQCGDRELMALTQQSPELEERDGVLAYQANSLLIAHALAAYGETGYSGLLMPCPYMRKLQNGKTEAGIGYFGVPSSNGGEWLSRLSCRSVSSFSAENTHESKCLEPSLDQTFDNEFGPGFSSMVSSFMACLQKSSAALGNPLFPCKGFTSYPRLELAMLGFGFMVIGQSIICLKTKISSDDPVWVALLAGGISEVYHLASIPAGINETDLAITKNAPDQAAAPNQPSVGRIWGESLSPLDGCRILFHEGTEKPYSMTIRPLPAICKEGVKDRADAQSWYEFAYKNKVLSYSEKIACLQRAVLLNPRDPRLWYGLGCHYELEGRDWYGAANAFNHVIFLYPKSGTAWFSLSQLWAARGFMSKAQECRARFDSLTSEDRRQ